MNLENMGISVLKKTDYTIYVIKVLNRYYIGSTKDLKQRICQHITNCYNEKCKQYNVPLYKYIRDNKIDFNKDCFRVEALILNCNKPSAFNLEKQIINEFKSQGKELLNERSPFRTQEERKAYMKAYDQSEERKAYDKARKQTEKYKAYEQSEERKQYMKAYYQTEKYKAYEKARKQTEKYKAYRKAYDKARYEKKKLEKLNQS